MSMPGEFIAGYDVKDAQSSNHRYSGRDPAAFYSARAKVFSVI
jgi:hypothetical protein